MREILFLSHRVPWPPDRGDKIRSHHILRALTELAPVHLACLADDDDEAEYRDPLVEKIAAKLIVERRKSQWRAGLQAIASGKPISVTSFASDELQAGVERLIRERPIDCIFAFSGQMAQFVPPDFRGRFVMDFVDVDSAKFASYGESGFGPMAWVNRREAKLLREFEVKTARFADICTFVSEVEADLFWRISGIEKQKVRALGNGIDLEYYDPAAVAAVEKPFDGPMLVFTGQMDYRPNVEAVVSFAKEVLPAIRKSVPAVQFMIVGRNPAPEVRLLADEPNVIVTGGVPDVRGWLKAADVVVAPLRIARGIQNKVLEAMAMARPVVASSAAAEGIDAISGQHFSVAQSPQEEAAIIMDLLSNPEKSAMIGQRARQLMADAYGWDAKLAGLPALVGMAEAPVAEAAE